MTLAKRTIAGVAMLVIVLVVIVAAAAVWLHTANGRAWLVETVEARARGAGVDLDIDVLDGSLLRRFTIEGIRVAAPDAAGAWIELDTLRVAWRPLALFDRTLRVESIDLAGLRLDQAAMPSFGADAESSAAENGGLSLPVAVEIEHLGADASALALSTGVTLDSVGVALNGRVTPAAVGIAAELEISELDARWVEQDVAVAAVRAAIDLASIRDWMNLEGALDAALRWRAAGGQLAVTTSAGRYRASLAAQLPSGELARFDDRLAEHPAVRATIEADGAVDPEDLEHRVDLEIASEAGSSRVDARLEGRTLSASFEVEAVDPSRWWRGIPAGEVTFQGDVGLAGVSELQAGSSVELRFAPSTVGRLTIDAAALSARTRGKIVEVDSLEVRASATRVRARGHYASLADLDAEVDARFADLSVWGDAIGREIGGRVELDARLKGGAGGLDGSVALLARRIESGLMQVERIDGEVTARGDTSAMRVAANLGLDELAVGGAAIGGCELSGAAVLRRLAFQEFDVALEAMVDSLPGARRLDASEIIVEADGRFEGERLSGRIERLRLRGAGGGEALLLRSPLDFAIRPGREIVVDHLDLALPSGALVGDVHAVPDSLAADLEVQHVELEEVSRLIGRLPVDTGRVDARIALRGGAGGIGGDLSVEASSLRVQGHGPVDGYLHLNLAPEAANVDVRVITAGDDSVTVRGRLPVVVATAAPFWGWKSSAFELELVAATDSVLVWTLGPIIAGTELAIDAHLSGPPTDVQLDLSAAVALPPVQKLDRLAIQIDGTVAEGRAQVDIAGGNGEVPVLEGAAEVPILLDLVGGVAVDGSLPLSSRLQVRGFDLGYLGPYIDDALQVAGLLDMDSKVAGTLEDPRFSGDLKLSGVRFELSPISLAFRDVAVEADFSNDRIVIRRGEGKTAQGTLRLEGSLPTLLTPDRDVDFQVVATGLNIDTRDIKRAAADLDLVVGGTLREPELTGKIQVNGATLQLPDQRQRRYLELTAAEMAELTGTPIDTTASGTMGGSDMPLKLDLKVEIPRAFFLRNNMLGVEIGGSLALLTGRAGILLNGELRSIRGRVDFAGQRFDVERGIVRFTGDTNPTLDIDATHDVEQWRVHILVLGTARDPEISLESEPPLPEADIISLLVFGRRAGDLSTDQQYTLADRATTMLAGMATAPLEAALADQLGLDMVKIDAGGRESTVTVGKYVNERTMVKVEQSLEESTRREFAVEYSLTRRLRLDVSTDERSQTGVDLFYEFDK